MVFLGKDKCKWIETGHAHSDILVELGHDDVIGTG